MYSGITLSSATKFFMKKYFIAAFIIISFYSCGVEIKSVVDNSLPSNRYANPLFIIPQGDGFVKRFTWSLKKNLDEKLTSVHQKGEVLLIEQSQNELKLNVNSDIEKIINEKIEKDKKDLIIIFKPIGFQLTNGGIQAVTYTITGIDTKSNQEVWKSKVSTYGYVGVGAFAKQTAKNVFNKLKNDKVI